jgi:lipoate-protein ligase A
MRYLDCTLPTAAENLALDEALLDEAEVSSMPLETLRFWESPEPMVVLGRSSRIGQEVRIDACRAENVPVLRRVSGGATIVAGPGCLMYALVLNCDLRPQLRSIDQAHQFVLRTLIDALKPAAPDVQHRGTCDLTLGDWKVSGNSVRCRRRSLLYHGTLLYDFPLTWIERYLTIPPRMPAYREGRRHEKFVANLPLTAEVIRQLLRTAWAAHEPCEDWPQELTARLASEKYCDKHWNEGQLS